jgi:hypothetical protein
MAEAVAEAKSELQVEEAVTDQDCHQCPRICARYTTDS